MGYITKTAQTFVTFSKEELIKIITSCYCKYKDISANSITNVELGKSSYNLEINIQFIDTKVASLDSGYIFYLLDSYLIPYDVKVETFAMYRNEIMFRCANIDLGKISI